MFAALRRAFNVEQGEGGRLTVLSLMAILGIIGISWGQIVLTALFLKESGAASFPYLFVANALVIVVSFAIYAYFADRFRNSSIMVGVMMFSLIGIVVGLALVQSAPPAIAYAFLYLVITSTSEVLSTHWGTYVSDFFDTLALKRIFPVLGAMVRVAYIIAASTVPFLNSAFSPTVVILMAGASLALMGALAFLMPVLVKAPVLEAATLRSVNQQRSGYWHNLREGFEFVSNSPFLKAFSIMSIMMMMTLAVLNFRAYRIFELNLDSQEEITNYLSLISLVGSLLILPIQAFLFSRLVARLGVGNMNMVFPLSTLANSVLLILFPRMLHMGGFTVFNTSTVNTAIRATNDDLLYNAVPLRVKARTRAFISGLVEPIGTITGGVLLFIPAILEENVLLPFIVVLTMGYVASAGLVTRRYSRALINLLEQENFAAILMDATREFVPDAATLRLLHNRIDETQDVDTKLFLAKVTIEMVGKEAIPILETLVNSDNHELRAGVLNLLVSSNLIRENVANLFIKCLADPNPAVRKAAITGIRQNQGTQSPVYQRFAYHMIHDPSPEVLAEVLPDIVVGQNLAQIRMGVQILQNYLVNSDPFLRKMAVGVIEKVNNPFFHHALAEQLNDPDDQVRLAVINAIRDIAQRVQRDEPAFAMIAHYLPARLEDHVFSIQLAAIHLIQWIQTPELLKQLTGMLGDSRPRIQREVIEALVRIGVPAVPALEAVLKEPSIQKDKLATMALVQIQPARYQSRLQEYLWQDLNTIYTNYAYLDALTALTEYPSIGVLQNTLEEYIDDIIEEVFFMLGAVHGTEEVAVIHSSLQSSSQREYANAAEALEALTTPEIARLIASLFKEDMDVEERLEIGQRQLSVQKHTPEDTLRALLMDTDTEWLRLITIFVLGEIGAAQKAQPEKTRRRKLTMDIFAKVMDNTSEEAPKEEEQPAQPAKTMVLSREEIESLLQPSIENTDESIRLAGRAANRVITGQDVLAAARAGEPVLSLVERIYFLKSVLFFQNMSVHQLTRLANVCDEELFKEDERIFRAGDPGGTLYVVISGKVGIEREKEKGTSARIATGEKRFYFGEATLFDNSLSETSAIALQDTLTLTLHHEPLVALLHESPRFSLALINVMSQRIQTVSQQIAELLPADSESRANIYDKLSDKLEAL